MLRLLRGQAKLAKKISLDDRLHAGFIGELLFDHSDDVDNFVLDEIQLVRRVINPLYALLFGFLHVHFMFRWQLSGALKLCNAQRSIRAQYLRLQLEVSVNLCKIRDPVLFVYYLLELLVIMYTFTVRKHSTPSSSL